MAEITKERFDVEERERMIEERKSTIEARKEMVEGEYPYNYFKFLFRDEGCLELIAQRKENVEELFDQLLDDILRPKEKQIIIGLFKEKLSYSGVVRKVGGNVQTVKNNLHKAARKLRCRSRCRRILYDADVLEEMARQAELKREEERKAMLEWLKNFDEEFLNSPIKVLNLSVRSYNCLRRGGIQCVRDLLELNDGQMEEHLAKIRNMGRTDIEEILNKLKSLGVRD